MTFYAEAMPTPLRAASLAAWGSAFLAGAVTLEEAVRAVEGEDEPHLVVLGSLGAPGELAETLIDLRSDGFTGLRLALPAPGDPLGLVGPPEVNQHVLAAGEAAVAVGPGSGARLGTAAGSVPALVPAVSTFGPPGDQGHCVTWRVWTSSPATPDLTPLSQAQRELADAMREATAALSQTSTTWRAADAAGTARRLRRWSGEVLPSAAGPRAEALAQRALQVAAIVDAARADDGGTLTAHSAAVRAGCLAALDRAARRGLVAAVAACCRESVSR